MSRDEQRAWDEFVRHAREDAIAKITESAIVMTLLPGDELDVKICLEVGAAVLLDKPIIAVALPGREVSRAMRRLATHVIEADPDTEEGVDEIGLAVAEILAGLEGTA